ncbi:MAG: hypothetical protein AAGJ46_05245 [Planctomycetota bacterium]
MAEVATLGEVPYVASLTRSYGAQVEPTPPDGVFLTEEFVDFGQTRTTVAYWTLSDLSAGADYTLEFAAAGSSMSLDAIVIDTFAVAASVPGDLDGSGVVDLGGFAAWKADFGAAGPVGDRNGDGLVDRADSTLWRDAYQSAAAPVVGLVPEPSAATALLVLGAALGFVGGVDWWNRPRRQVQEESL